MADDTNTESNTERVLSPTETAQFESLTQDSPEVLGDAGKKALQAEREARKQAETAKKELEAQISDLTAKVETFEAGNRSEIENARIAAEKATEAQQAAENARAEAELKLLRYEIAQEKGITGSALNLLDGATREELEAKADSILSIIDANKSAPVIPQEGHAPTTSGGPGADFANAVRALF